MKYYMLAITLLGTAAVMPTPGVDVDLAGINVGAKRGEPTPSLDVLSILPSGVTKLVSGVMDELPVTASVSVE